MPSKKEKEESKDWQVKRQKLSPCHMLLLRHTKFPLEIKKLSFCHFDINTSQPSVYKAQFYKAICLVFVIFSVSSVSPAGVFAVSG